MHSTRFALAILLVFWCSNCLAAPQNQNDENTADHPWLLRTAAVVGGVGLMMSADESTRDWFGSHRTGAYKTSADIVRPFGEWPAFVSVSVGLSAYGLVTGNDAVLTAGERAAMSIAVSAIIEGTAKYTISRRRPKFATGWDDFEFFDSYTSMPSGHATVAFALAKSLSDDINRDWASYGLYSLAVASSVARLVDNMHWLSDLALGAAVGYASAELVSDRVMAPAHRKQKKQGPHLALTMSGPAFVWRF